MRYPRLRHLLLPSIFAGVLTGSAHAAWLDDPLGAKKDIAPYTENRRLRPATCPSIPTGNHVYTLEEVVVLALCNNPDTRSAYLSLVSQSFSYAQSYSGYFPTVTGTLGYSHNTFFSPHSSTITRGSGISADVTLYDFGQRELSVDIAEQTLLAAGHSYSGTLQGVIAAALNGYYTLLTSQNNVAVTEESERFAKAGYEAAKLKHEIGQVALADELQGKSSYSSALLATQSAHNTLAIQKAALARLMGLPPEETLQVAELDDTNLTLQPFGGELPRLITEAKEKRVDLIAQRAALESAKISLKKTKRENLGTVTAGISSGFDKAGILRGTGSGNNAIGVSVSVPIFTGFTQTYNERAARTAVESSQEALATTELNVEQDVWNAWHNYQTAQASWETSLDLIKSATEFKDVALGRYKEGIGTILDVLSAQSQYSSALQSQLQTRYNLLTTRIDLVRAVGVLDLETMRPETTVPLAPGANPEPQPVPLQPVSPPIKETPPPTMPEKIEQPLTPEILPPML